MASILSHRLTLRRCFAAKIPRHSRARDDQDFAVVLVSRCHPEADDPERIGVLSERSESKELSSACDECDAKRMFAVAFALRCHPEASAFATRSGAHVVQRVEGPLSVCRARREEDVLPLLLFYVVIPKQALLRPD
jgi:hypothetical protein